MIQFIMRIVEQLGQLSPRLVAYLVIASGAVILLCSRSRISLYVLFAQYLLLSIFVGLRVYGPLFIAQALIGLAACLILILSASRLAKYEGELSEPNTFSSWLYSFLVVLFSGMIAYGVWQANLLQLGWLEGMVVYSLAVFGLVMASISNNPLALGMGIMMAMNGFAIASIFLNLGLLVTGMWGIIVILLALAVSAGVDKGITEKRAHNP